MRRNRVAGETSPGLDQTVLVNGGFGCGLINASPIRGKMPASVINGNRSNHKRQATAPNMTMKGQVTPTKTNSKKVQPTVVN